MEAADVRCEHTRVGGGDRIDVDRRPALAEVEQMQKCPLREARVAGHDGRVLQKLRAAIQKFGRQMLLQNRHIGEGDEHIAVLVKNGKIGG